MPDFRLVQLGVVTLAAVAISAAKPGPTPATVSACDASSPHAAAFLAGANATFTKLNSAQITRLRMTAAPRSVTLVTQATTCEAVLTAHNAFFGKYAAYKVTRAVIAKAGSSYLVEVPGGSEETEIVVYDSTPKFVAVY